MKFKFIVKPPPKKQYLEEFLKFEKDFEADQEFTEKNFPKNAGNLAKKAFEAGFKRIIFVAGDGLLNEGVNGIMEAACGKIPSDFSIGIIPTGSGNDFAKALAIPRNIREAFDIIRKDKIISVDMARANQRFFVNCFSVGLDAQINDTANKIKENYKFLPKQGSYLFAAIREIILDFKSFDLKIEGNGIHMRGEMLLAALTNTPSYGGMFKINPGASLQDGLFNFCCVKTMGRVKALISICRVIKGTHTNLPEVKMFKASFLKISSSDFVPWEVDGEVQKPEKEFNFEVFPGALNVLIP